MTAEHTEAARDHLCTVFGAWTAHNIELAPGVFTMGAVGYRDNEVLFHRAVQTAQDVLRRPIAGMKVLDLGCLEGGYAIEFARHGANCVGVEVRRASIEKARFAANALKLRNIQFVTDDVRNISAASLGQFDVILCWGLLYHLDASDVFDVLTRLKAMCRGILIIDTHISLAQQAKVTYDGHTYWGGHYLEHPQGASPQQKESNLWASIDNNTSFWPTRPSLFNFLTRIGFTTVLENASPLLPGRSADRINVTAVAGEPIDVHPQGVGDMAPRPMWREEDPRFAPSPQDACAPLH